MAHGHLRGLMKINAGNGGTQRQAGRAILLALEVQGRQQMGIPSLTRLCPGYEDFLSSFLVKTILFIILRPSI